MSEQPTTYPIPTDDGPMPALLWGGVSGSEEAGGDATQLRPGLVVFQEIFGLSDYVRSRCADLAGLGYVVLAPQIYWRIGGEVVTEGGPDFLPRAMALMQRADWDSAVSDGVAAVHELRRASGGARVGAVGFCYGGGLAYQVAATMTGAQRPDALVSYYGSALPQLVEAGLQVEVPSLHHFGTADDFIPMQQVEAIRAWVSGDGAREDVEVKLHEGAGHAFDNPHPMFHHGQASRDAWAQTVDFLARHHPIC